MANLPICLLYLFNVLIIQMTIVDETLLRDHVLYYTIEKVNACVHTSFAGGMTYIFVVSLLFIVEYTRALLFH